MIVVSDTISTAHQPPCPPVSQVCSPITPVRPSRCEQKGWATTTEPRALDRTGSSGAGDRQATPGQSDAALATHETCRECLCRWVLLVFAVSPEAPDCIRPELVPNVTVTPTVLEYVLLPEGAVRESISGEVGETAAVQT